MNNIILTKNFNWAGPVNRKDQINRKPDGQKNDQMTEKAKNHKTKSTVLNLIFGAIYNYQWIQSYLS